MIKTNTAYRVADALWTVEGQRWEKYGHRRIYVDAEKVFKGAGMEPTHYLECFNFYLNLDTAKWSLTGDRKVDKELISYLNSLASCPEINEAYASKSRAAQHEKNDFIDRVESTTDAEILAMDDTELIACIENSRLYGGSGGTFEH